MKKPLITLSVAATVGLGSFFGTTAVKTEAASISNLQKQKDQVSSQRTNLNSNMNAADQKISKLQGQQADVQTELKRIGLEIDNTTADINEKTAKVEETKRQIAKLQGEIKVLQARIQKRNELLKQRARNYQENGVNASYIAVLMGSQSFSDFIDRADAVATIMQADQDILKQAEADEQALDHKQVQVQTDLSNQNKMVNDLKALQVKLNTQKSEQDKLFASLNVQVKQAEDEKMSMQEQDQLLAAQETAIKKAIQLEQQRQAEAARKAAAAAKAPSSSPSGSSSSSSGGGGSVTAPPVSSGSFTRPTNGVITSTFGPRDGGFHYGVDFANSGSNVPIVAAADGVVSRSYTSSSYGECVFISHYINGHLYTTVYAHMRLRLVSDGAAVSKGQLIGYMGYTGDVSPPGPRGQHLHFELYVGEWTADHHNAINPLTMLP